MKMLRIIIPAVILSVLTTTSLFGSSVPNGKMLIDKALGLAK